VRFGLSALPQQGDALVAGSEAPGNVFTMKKKRFLSGISMIRLDHGGFQRITTTPIVITLRSIGDRSF